MTIYFDTRTQEPRGARNVEVKLSDGFELRRPPQGWNDRILEACGLIPVTMTPRPPDTATTTHERTVELVADVPTVVWVERPKTQDELDADAAQADDREQRRQVRLARTELADFLASGSPGPADAMRMMRVMARVLDHMIKDQYGDQ